MRIFKDERGQAMIVTLVGVAVLMGALGLAIDVGVLFRARRNMQIAADAAAMAGAVQLFYGPSSNVQTVAYAAATANGVDHSNAANSVLINTPPIDGPNTGCSSCVEARVAAPNPTFFLGVLGFGAVNVSARAVAGAPGVGSGCIYLMDPTMPSELDLQGSAAINAPGCGIYVNSNSTTAVTYNNGHTGNINAATLAIVGNDTAAQSNLTNVSVSIKVAPEGPPISTQLPGIPPGGCTQTSTLSSITTGNASTVSGSSANNVVCFTAANVQIASGVVLPGALGSGVLYVFENGVQLSGGVQIGCYGSLSPCGATPPSSGPFLASSTYGATLDLDGGALSQGNAQLTIFAPTSGTYNSIALMQPSTNLTGGSCPAYSGTPPCMLIQRGSSNSTFDGIIYAPREVLEIQDGGGAIRNATGVIAAGIYAKGSGSLNINSYSPANPTTTPFKAVTMVE
jgi:hypothetical protein